MADKTVVIDLRVGDTMRIAGAAVSLREKSGRRARLVVTAPAGVAIEPPQRAADVAQSGVRSNLVSA